MKLTPKQVRDTPYGPQLMALIHKAGGHVVIGNAAKPLFHALVEDEVGGYEHCADGANPWSALRKAALAWAKADER